MARKPRSLPDEILQRVIALREGHSSWIKIQKEVKIDRRTAKRAYEDWQRTKSIDELKAARKGVAEEEFRNHLRYLVALAGALAQTLDVPTEVKAKMSAADVLKKMWGTSSLGNYCAYGVRDVAASVEGRSLLFASLKTHTSAKVRWDALSDWERAWDDCRSALEELKQEIGAVVHNVLEQKKLSVKIQKSDKKQDVEERLVGGVIHVIWEHILRPNDSDQFPVVETKDLGGERCQLLFGRDRFAAGIILETSLCVQLAEASKWAAKNVLLSPKVEAVTHLIQTLRDRIVELRVSLNPLSLGPMIMSTRCDLCPA